MVNEKEEHYEEEGEYHFSDDQVNYDLERDAPKASPALPFNKEALLAKFNQHRRKILGAVSLFILIGVVYRILIPSATPPATDFNQAAAAKVRKPTTTTTTVSQPATLPAASASVARSPVMENKPVAAQQQKLVLATPVAAQQTEPLAAAVAMTPPAAPVNTVPPPTTSVPGSLPTPTRAAPPSIASPSTQEVTNAMNTGQASAMDMQARERMMALEQQSAAMMNLLQTEYAQKIADTETQTNAMRGKIEELTKRINHMAASLNQITQLLQGVSGRSQTSGVMGSAVPDSPAPRSTEPRMIYSVQAIIPGRAWLKSDAGDTVTVAEGDYLKGYGRVTKIDPYDGIVAIDTGNKIINLSYGVGGE